MCHNVGEGEINVIVYTYFATFTLIRSNFLFRGGERNEGKIHVTLKTTGDQKYLARSV